MIACAITEQIDGIKQRSGRITGKPEVILHCACKVSFTEPPPQNVKLTHNPIPSPLFLIPPIFSALEHPPSRSIKLNQHNG